MEEDPNWSNLLIESALLNGNFEETNWFPDEQYIIAAEENIMELIGEDAFETEYLQFRAENPNGVNEPFSFWFNSSFEILSEVAQRFLILLGTNCK